MNPREDEHNESVGVESCSVPEDPRVVKALDEYLSAVDAGRGPDRDAFLAAHPDISKNLAKCLDGLEFIERARPRLQESALSPAQIGPSPLSSIAEGTLGDYRL